MMEIVDPHLYPMFIKDGKGQCGFSSMEER
jgi:hypothetical protein